MSEYLEGSVYEDSENGNITIFNIQNIKRMFYICNVPKGESRGGHAHKQCIQYISCPIGSVKLELTMKNGITRKFILNSPDITVKVNPMTWVDMSDFASGTVALVMATHHYDADDYIYEMNKIL